MIEITCGACTVRQLLWPTDLRGLLAVEEGHVVCYRCPRCSHEGMDMIARDVDRPTAAVG